MSAPVSASDQRRLPAVEHALRLARRLTGRELAGVTLLDGGPPLGDPLDPDHPLVWATLSDTGVHQAGDLPPEVTGPLRSYAGVRLGSANGGGLGVLWVGDRTPGLVDEAGCAALQDLAVLLQDELERSGAMTLAAEVQRQLLPERAPAAPGYELAAACRPALEVGGDFYDWWSTDADLRLVLADVMGKGVPAAIVAAAVRAMLRAALTFHEPAAALSRVAGDLQSDLDQVAKFATCFAARLELATGRLCFADAGHGLCLVLRNDGSLTLLDSDDPPLGTLPGTTWQGRETTLAPGEVLVAVSDGVLDLFESPAEGLGRALALHRQGASAADFVADLAELDRHGDHSDDLTVVAVRRTAG